MYAYVLHLDTQTEYRIQVFQVNWKPFHTETQKTNVLGHITHAFLLFCVCFKNLQLKQVLHS